MLEFPNLQKININALEVCKIIQTAGFESYIVGGCVRDLLLGVNPKDWDVTTNATPEEVTKLFEHVLPTGIEHGTVTVLLNKEPIEVTTFRTEGKYSDGRRPDNVQFVSSLKEDLARRDLTINAIAFNPISQELSDPFGGIHDLQNQIIRTVGDAKSRFNEDGLRILRVARFASKLNYKIEPKTISGMYEARSNLVNISKERIKDELCKMLNTLHPEIGLNLLIQTGLMEYISPELLSKHVITGALRHQIPLIQKYQGEVETRLALLFFSCSNNEIESELKRLTFSSLEIKKVLYLNSNIEKYYNTFQNKGFGEIKHFIAHLKNTAINENSYEEFCKYANILGCKFANDHIALMNINIPLRKELKINGNDLIMQGFSQGPKIKIALDAAYNLIIENPNFNNKEYLLGFCEQYK